MIKSYGSYGALPDMSLAQVARQPKRRPQAEQAAANIAAAGGTAMEVGDAAFFIEAHQAQMPLWQQVAIGTVILGAGALAVKWLL